MVERSFQSISYAAMFRPGRALEALLLSTLILAGSSIGLSRPAAAQESAERISFSVPAGPLGQALMVWGRQAGIQVSYLDAVTTGKSTPGLSASLPPEQALARLLSGSGLRYSFSDPRSVVITGATAAGGVEVDGTVMLGTIVIGGRPRGLSGDVYSDAAPTAYVTAEEIERFRGSSPADLFRGTPGVMSGEARNGAGSVDPNIRGLQGMGRVTTTVDGAENTVMVYQGYQGVSNRSYVDPDFIAGVDIHKGADVSSFGNAGSVAMRTLGVDDIIEPGRKTGFRFNIELGGNTSDPVANTTAGYLFTNLPGGVGTYTESPTGMDRPSALAPTSHSASLIGALRGSNWDLVLGYAKRERGNYHAGTGEDAASPVYTGPQPYCMWGTCIPAYDYLDYVTHSGVANYRAGEEVLNSELSTRSLLAKGGLTFGNGHRLQLSYNRFRGTAGDVMASRQGSVLAMPTQRARATETDVDSVVLRYSWAPADSNLIDLKATVYWTGLEQRNMSRGANRNPVTLGLPADFLPGSETDMFGAEVTNTSRIATAVGEIRLDYGLSGRIEDTNPTSGTREVEGWLDLRDSRRSELAIFAKAEWAANDWLTFNGGLRYQKYWSKDRNTDPVTNRDSTHTYGVHMSRQGLSGSLGVVAEITPEWQVFANYSNTLRMPALYESSTAFTFSVNPDIRPERSRNLDIGATFQRTGMFAEGDNARLKLGYFDWTVDNYLARLISSTPELPLWMEVDNIHEARFSGLEVSASYERKGFAADFAANYYNDVTFCRTADSCSSTSLYGDYATNQVPPEYSLSLTLSQKFLDDDLRLGGRVTRVGNRAISHDAATIGGLSNFITLVQWRPHTLVDLFAEYSINDKVTARLRIENVTDEFYVDPLGLVTQPGPGRTVYVGVTARF